MIPGKKSRSGAFAIKIKRMNERKFILEFSAVLNAEEIQPAKEGSTGEDIYFLESQRST